MALAIEENDDHTVCTDRIIEGNELYTRQYDTFYIPPFS